MTDEEDFGRLSAGRLREMPLGQAASLVGQESGLGAVTGVARWSSNPATLSCGCVLVLLVCMAGVVLLALASSADINPDILGYPAAALAVGAVLIVIGLRRSVLLGWLARYEGGYAQLLPDAPGPRVVHWADIAEVTATFRTTTTAVSAAASLPFTDFSGFSARLLTGEPAPEIAGTQWKVDRLVAEALRAVGPRVIPAAIAAYESGQPVAFGPAVGVDQHGIAGSLLAAPVSWPDIESIEMRQVEVMRGTRVVTEIRLRFPRQKPTRRPTGICLSGLPNGIFLPGVIAHAAVRHGVPVSKSKAR